MIKSRAIKDALAACDRKARMFPSCFPILILPTVMNSLALALIDSVEEKVQLAGLFLFIAVRGAFRANDLLNALTFTYSSTTTIAIYGVGKTGTPTTTHVDIFPLTSVFLERTLMTSFHTTTNPFKKSTIDIVRTELRKIHPMASLRSIRSSVVVAMGVNGTEVEEIRLLTHHKNENMTLHYLRNGLYLTDRCARNVAAQQNLLNLPKVTPTPMDLKVVFENLNDRNKRMRVITASEEEEEHY